MDSSYILPFVSSIQNVFSTMLQLQVQVGKPEIKGATDPTYDVSGIIGMSGDIEGSVVLSFPTDAAERVIQLFTGMELGHTHEDFADAVGELVNMISGSAKAQMEGMKVSISCPTVVVGQKHQVYGRKDVVTICIPCESDCGQFTVEVSTRNNTVGEAVAKSNNGAVNAA